MRSSSSRCGSSGSRHAFNDIADTTGDHVSLAGLPRVIEIDRAAGTVTVDGAIRYGDLCPVLEEAGLALHNLASLPHISIAGACITGTHGSGDRLRQPVDGGVGARARPGGRRAGDDRAVDGSRRAGRGRRLAGSLSAS